MVIVSIELCGNEEEIQSINYIDAIWVFYLYFLVSSLIYVCNVSVLFFH